MIPGKVIKLSAPRIKPSLVAERGACFIPTKTMRPKLKKIWLVWNPKAQFPRRYHKTKEEATLEAWRLAVKNPGNSFMVMEAVDVRKLELKKP